MQLLSLQAPVEKYANLNIIMHPKGSPISDYSIPNIMLLDVILTSDAVGTSVKYVRNPPSRAPKNNLKYKFQYVSINLC